MKLTDNKCVGLGNSWNISNCKVKKYPSYDNSQVIQTPHGLLVCNPNTSVTIFKADFMGVIHTTVENITRPTFFGSAKADSVLVGYNHYPINQLGPSTNITEIYSVHDNLDEMSQFDHISSLLNDTHLENINQLSLIHPIHTLHVISWVLFIG